jgi:capsule assembly protein Wzi
MTNARRLQTVTSTVVVSLLLVSLMLAATSAHGSGASPYLPLNLSPEIERKVERVLVLAGEPALTRPVPIAKILKALPKARRLDPQLCAQVDNFLDHYFGEAGIGHASVEVAAPIHSTMTLPNARGERVDSPIDGSATVFYRPFDHVVLTGGFDGYGGTDGRVTPDGTIASLGDEYLQIDAGWRDHWFSPLTDSSMLISTEAPPMPSVTISNQTPIGPLGFDYQFFYARMSSTQQIVYKDTLNEGSPKLVGAHIGFAPASGWSLSANAEWQFGGGGRPGSFSSFFNGIFKRTVVPTSPDGATNSDGRFSNRTISFTSAYIVPTRHPFETYVEYGARDTLHGNPFRFHNTSLSAGAHFPELFKHVDLTIEASEWQNSWYTDYVWLEGLTEYGYVIGNWGGDWRTFDNSVGGQSIMALAGYTLSSGDEASIRLRTLQNRGYQFGTVATPDYHRAEMVTLEYAQPRNGYTRGLTLDAGRDVYGKGFGRLGAFARFDGGSQVSDRSYGGDDEGESEDDIQQRTHGVERFVDVGVSTGRLDLSFGGFTSPTAGAPVDKTVVSPHLGLGVRKRISNNQDLGVRLDLDDYNSDAMLGLRMLDYRYRIYRHLGFGAFIGFARYAAPTPAMGYYAGAGLQWRDVLPKWDLSLEGRYFDHLQRDKVLPSDPQNGDPVEWYNLFAPTLSISRRF